MDGSTAVERYDIRRNRWSRVRSMPLGVNHSTATVHARPALRARRVRRRARALRAHGGLLEYDPGRNAGGGCADSPTARAAHAAAVVGDRLYVAGGADRRGRSAPSRCSTSAAAAGAAARASPARPATTRPAWPQRPLLRAGRQGRLEPRRGGALRRRASGAGSGCPTCASRAAGIASALVSRRADRGVRRREPGAGRHDHRPGRAVRHPQAALAAAAGHAHTAPRARRRRARRPRVRGRGRPAAGLPLLAGRSSSWTCADATVFPLKDDIPTRALPDPDGR